MPRAIAKKVKRKPQKPPKPPSYPWKARNNPDIKDIIFADKREFKEKWLEWNECPAGNEKNFLSTMCYPTAWVHCYMSRNPNLTETDARAWFIKMFIIESYGHGIFGDTEENEKKNVKKLNEMMRDFPRDILAPTKKEYYSTWYIDDEEESDDEEASDDEEESDDEEDKSDYHEV